jgi:glutamate synthase (ferredoxin)
MQCNLVVETAQCFSVHHFACLLSYGAQVVCPYLALRSVRALTADIDSSVKDAQQSYRTAITDGILKVMSKMGISALSSYIGAETMECIGLGPIVIAQCFGSTSSPACGLEIENIEVDTLRFHNAAFSDIEELPNFGAMKFKTNGEFHGNNPALVKALHAALSLKGSETSAPQVENFRSYSNLVKKRAPAAVRDLLRFESDKTSMPLADVEDASSIVRRFCTGGMSLGSLSKEAHETVAIAMNRLGGRSNSGEGGEDPKRYYPISNVTPEGTSPDFPGLRGLRSGDRASSAVRQVASARFGVTAEYLVTSEQLEIKIAQGAKPGEGGQLPGAKNSEYIAKLRRAKPGITLISPPPHHDIYSIEDLAQLIFDLRQVNPHAKISVKLVSSAGIGTIAAGVAKAGADIIQISGHDGGTGASPLSSIKHAGFPWEFGLAEAHRALLANGLRKGVVLRVDGGIRTGWDVITAALLGADEYGFGSIALIAQGCIMARVCHTNNCPVGITSQKEHLRAKFSGQPQHLVEFFQFIAQEVRHELSTLGYRSLAEIVGRNDLLRKRDRALPKADLSLDMLLASSPESRTYSIDTQRYSIPDPAIGDQLIADPEIQRAIEEHAALEKIFSVTNRDRTVGARIAGAIALRWGDEGFRGRIDLRCTGTAGQSFAAFNVKGMHLLLEGEANDYVGKGMSGGEVVIRPPEGTAVASWQNVIVGNTCLYGATGGEVFISGQAGERFAVRNCNAVAVVEGVGDHGCEYMTGGAVVVLAEIGRNFGAGMTGGLAFVYDEHDRFADRFNRDGDKYVGRLSDVNAPVVRALIAKHFHLTTSRRAEHILANWQDSLTKFWEIIPPQAQFPSSLLGAKSPQLSDSSFTGHPDGYLPALSE